MTNGETTALATATAELQNARVSLEIAAKKLDDAGEALNAQNSQIKDAAATLSAARSDETLLKALQEGYRQHANTLRLWFLVFGVGAPAAFVARDDLFNEVRNIPNFRCIVFLFGAGVAIQMLLAVADKYSCSEWLYKRLTANEDPNASEESLFLVRRPWGWAKFWLQQNCISALADLVTIGAFVAASWMTLNAIADKQPPTKPAAAVETPASGPADANAKSAKPRPVPLAKPAGAN